MPMYIKQDIFRVLERRNGAVYKTKKVGFHWFLAGKCPVLGEFLDPELVKQNGFPEGEYFYSPTLESVIESRCPAGGKYSG